VEGKFFSGELYLDLEKKAYQSLGFKRFGIKEIFSAIFSKKSRDANAKAKGLGLGGNMKGDGYQNGGCLVVSAGGDSTLFSYKQEHVAEHPDNADILKALNIQQQTAE